MTDDDHIDDDELQLKQMRSVWLSMRDDDAEPSDRGMAALMAAAREQAAAMKPQASWWTRFLDQLRRPPVLAMATVVVLIGGAVAISQRKDAGDMPQLESEQAKGDVADMKAPAPKAGDVDDQGAAPPVHDDRDQAEGAAGSAATVVAQPEAPPPITNPRPPVAHKPQKPERKSESKTEMAFDALKESAPPPADPAANRPGAGAPMELAVGGEEADMTPKGNASPESTTQTGDAGRTKPVTRQPLPPIEGEDRAGKDKATAIAALVKQCEVAAAKNDCAAVRTIAQKIAKQDPALYKQKVAKNATIARCLSEGTIQTLE